MKSRITATVAAFALYQLGHDGGGVQDVMRAAGLDPATAAREVAERLHGKLKQLEAQGAAVVVDGVWSLTSSERLAFIMASAAMAPR